MSAGLFFTDVPGGDTDTRGVVFVPAPGDAGLDGIGIERIEQVPTTYQVRFILSDGSVATVDLPPGPAGDDAVPPSFVMGNTSVIPLGSAPIFTLRALGNAVYALDLALPDASASATAAQTAAAQATAGAATVAGAVAVAGPALAGYQDFRKKYLGALANDPTTDLDGNALIVGAEYFNTTNNDKRVWNGTTWRTAYTVITGAVASFKGRTGSVVPQTGDYTAAQVTGAVAGPASPAADTIPTFNANGSVKSSGAKIGTGAGNVPPLDANGYLQALDGRNLLNLPIVQKRYDNVVILTASKTWVAPANIRGRVTVVGGPATGGLARNSGITMATGASGAGLSVKAFTATAGQSYTATVGAPGATVSSSAASVATNGNPGGASSFVGNGLNVVANGGNGGLAAITGTSLAGVAGGTASGGDVNYTGGASGGISNATAGSASATGGGAVAYFGTAYASGSISNSNGVECATGGAGVGGASAALANPTSQTSTGGGGVGGPSIAVVSQSGNNGGPDIFGVYGNSSTFNYNLSFYPFNLYYGGGASGAASSAAFNGGPGAGGGSTIRPNGSPTGSGGLFAGGGGSATIAGANGSANGGAGKYGGGGGGSATTGASTSVPTQASAGDNGLIIIEYDLV